MAKLVITSGQNRGTSFPIGDSAVIGRLPRNEVAIQDDTGASRQHARVYKQGGRYFVVDLNSKNGTFVNGEAIQKHELRTGDEVLVGGTYFRLEEADAVPDVAHVSPADTPFSGSDSSVSLRSRTGASTTVSEKAIRFSKHAGSGRSRGTQGSITKTSLAWMRADLAQTSGLYRFLVYAGLVVLIAGLGYLAFTLTAG